VVFLDTLEQYAPFSPKIIQRLDEVYGFHEKDNAELRLRFYRSALKSGPEYAQKAAGELTLSWQMSDITS
jgi:leukotriene-A4 hydrolase